MSNLLSPSSQNRTRREWPNLSSVPSSQNWTSRVWPRPGRHETGNWKYRRGKSCDAPDVFVLGSCLPSQLIRQQERGIWSQANGTDDKRESVEWRSLRHALLGCGSELSRNPVQKAGEWNWLTSPDAFTSGRVWAACAFSLNCSSEIFEMNVFRLCVKHIKSTLLSKPSLITN
jgi:hypothetical protein